MPRFSSSHRFLPLLLAGIAVCSLRAQDGAVDGSFAPTFDGAIRSVAALNDGSALVSGDFHTVNGTSRAGVTRIKADGSLDPLYNPNSIAKGGPIALATDGTAFATDNNGHVIRVNADGRANPTFNAQAALVSVGGTIHTLATQADGKILVGGDFNQVNNSTFTDGVVRLNADGTLDAAFVSHAGFYSVKAIALLADGSFYAAGGNGSGNAARPIEMARLDASGALLASYDATPPTSGFSNVAEISQLQVQSDGKILLSGRFGTVQGATLPNIARLNADGSVDSSFNPGRGPASFDTITALLLQADGKILVGGGFTTFGGAARKRVARLNADGSVDASFDPGAGADSSSGEFNGVETLALGANGAVFVGGDFTLFGGAAHPSLARLVSGGVVTPPPPTGKQADLGLSVVDPKSKFNKKGIKLVFKANLAVTNAGDKAAKNVDVAAYLSDDAALNPAADVLMGTISLEDFGFPKVPKKGTTPFAVKFTTPANGIVPLTGKYIILVVDPAGAVPDKDRSNNQYVFGPL